MRDGDRKRKRRPLALMAAIAAWFEGDGPAPEPLDAGRFGLVDRDDVDVPGRPGPETIDLSDEELLRALMA